MPRLGIYIYFRSESGESSTAFGTNRCPKPRTVQYRLIWQAFWQVIWHCMVNAAGERHSRIITSQVKKIKQIFIFLLCLSPPTVPCAPPFVSPPPNRRTAFQQPLNILIVRFGLPFQYDCLSTQWARGMPMVHQLVVALLAP